MIARTRDNAIILGGLKVNFYAWRGVVLPLLAYNGLRDAVWEDLEMLEQITSTELENSMVCPNVICSCE